MFNCLSPVKLNKSTPHAGKLDLYDSLKNSHSKIHNEHMNDYYLDKELLDYNPQVYYNPQHIKLLVSVII